jgi:hypothetical protein
MPPTIGIPDAGFTVIPLLNESLKDSIQRNIGYSTILELIDCLKTDNFVVRLVLISGTLSGVYSFSRITYTGHYLHP